MIALASHTTKQCFTQGQKFIHTYASCLALCVWNSKIKFVPFYFQIMNGSKVLHVMHIFSNHTELQIVYGYSVYGYTCTANHSVTYSRYSVTNFDHSIVNDEKQKNFLTHHNVKNILPGLPKCLIIFWNFDFFSFLVRPNHF